MGVGLMQRIFSMILSPLEDFMNIRHRLQLMGCDLELESQPGQGTRVIIHIPPAQVQR